MKLKKKKEKKILLCNNKIDHVSLKKKMPSVINFLFNDIIIYNYHSYKSIAAVCKYHSYKSTRATWIAGYL